MSEIRIEDLVEKLDIEDGNIIIVEDDEDTKKCTVLELKRSFNGDGDEPSSYKYYSSEYVKELVNSLSVQISAAAKQTDIDALKKMLSQVITSNGTGKDTELVTARGIYNSLSERLDADAQLIDDNFIQFPEDSLSGTKIDVSRYSKGEVTLSIPSNAAATTVYIEGINRLYIPATALYNEVVPINDQTGLQYTLTRAKNRFAIPFNNDGSSIPAGTYYFYSMANSDNSALINAKADLIITYADGSTLTVPYNFASVICINLTKYATSFTIAFNTDVITSSIVFTLENIMLCNKSGVDKYHKYCDSSIQVPAEQALVRTINVGSVQYIRRSAGIINVSIKDDSFTGTYIRDELNKINEVIDNSSDYCGLITNEGEYFYADTITEADNNYCVLTRDSKKRRNNHDSIHVQLMEYKTNTKPQFTMYLQDSMNMKDSGLVSVQLYIDATTFERFSDSDGIQILLSSDGIVDPVNYFHINLDRTRFVQGWNTIKFKTTELLKHGSPKGDAICTVTFKVFFSEALSGKEFWINSIIVGQRMKPTVLFAFDGIYESGFDYQYPYLYSRDISATIFANDKNTLTKEYMDKLAILRYQYDWDLANDGCNPNKEIMGKDDNCREQYMAVKDTRQWIVDNFCSEIYAYNAPFGILRPVTVPILQKLGFKMAKVDSTSYCSFFGENDFSIPMHLLSNLTTAEDMINKIKYAIETGQTICIYTGNVTKYGDEIAAKMEVFESVIAYIQEQVQLGNLQCLTFEQFYDKCTQH